MIARHGVGGLRQPGKRVLRWNQLGEMVDWGENIFTRVRVMVLEYLLARRPRTTPAEYICFRHEYNHGWGGLYRGPNLVEI